MTLWIVVASFTLIKVHTFHKMSALLSVKEATTIQNVTSVNCV